MTKNYGSIISFVRFVCVNVILSLNLPLYFRSMEARSQAALVAFAVLAGCALLLELVRSSGTVGTASPLALSTTVLASSSLDWLGGGTYGDPYPANGRLSPQAHLAPAALAAEAGWKETVGSLFGDARAGKSDPVQERGEPHGRLLVAAKEGEKLWQEQIKAMQAGELQANRDVMNTVSLLRGGNKRAELQPTRPAAPSAVQLSASADRKSAAHARLASLAATRKSTVGASDGKGQMSAAQASPAPAKQAQGKGTREGALVKKGEIKSTATQKLAARPSQAQVLKSVTVKPTDLSALDVATSDSSRHAMSSFFDSLAARDEAKHVLHESRYPRTHSVRSMLPTSVMPAAPHKTQMTHLEKEVTWLRKRVEVLQDALLKDNASGEHGSQKKATAAPRKQASPGGSKTSKTAKSTGDKHEPAKPAATRLRPASKTYLELTQPPPRGCPLFAAPGERLPVDCPRVPLARLDLHRCPDGAIRLACRDETIPRGSSALVFEGGGGNGNGDDDDGDDSFDEAESH